MMQSSNWERAIKVTSEVMRVRTRRVEESLKPFAGFFNSCADAIAEGLKSISPLAVKCSVSEADIKKIPLASFRSNCVKFEASGKTFNACFQVDRQFNNLLCDAGLGGNGLWITSGDDALRPPSKFEAMLVNHFVKAVAECIPKVHLAAAGHEIVLVKEEEPGPQETSKAQHTRCISVKFLVNIVSLSAEISICFPQSEVEQAFRASVLAPQQVDARMEKALSHCPFEVSVLLPPQLMNIDAILALEPDSVLRLEARPHDYAVLKVEGMEVAKGKIKIHPNKVGLLLQ
jgi:flagellar motor switch protein FliM